MIRNYFNHFLFIQMTNKVALAIDFGNNKLRIGVSYNDKVEIIKNEENFSSFSQILIAKEKSLIFGIEAEKNYAGSYDYCFKEFKYNILNRINKDDYRAMIIEILKYYKLKSEEYVRNRFNENIEAIDKVILIIPTYDIDNHSVFKEVLKECSKKAGFKEIKKIYEEFSAIRFYEMSISEQSNTNYYSLFNLGSLFFVSSFYDKSSLIGFKFQAYERLNESNGGRKFFPKLQNLFDQKLKHHFSENILKRLLKSDYHDFEKSFNDDIFSKNKKYLAECYKKYHEVLNSFSGTVKSIHLEFRHILNEQIEIEITREEINQVLEETHKEIQLLIDGTKRFLHEKNLDLASVVMLITGNGFKFPGVKDMFKKEFPDNFHQRQVFYDEEIITIALQYCF